MLFSVFLGVIGQLFFKLGINAYKAQHGALALGPQAVLVFLQPLVFIGLACYGMASVTYIVVLSRVPLSVAYPIVSLTYPLVVFISQVIFKEAVSGIAWAGVLCICCGVALIGRGMGSAGPAAPAPTPAVTSGSAGAGAASGETR